MFINSTTLLKVENTDKSKYVCHIVYLDDPNQSCLHHQDPLSENGDVMGEFSYL